MLLLQNERYLESEHETALARELLHRLVRNPRQPSRGHGCFGAVAVALIPIGACGHSSKHTGWPQEKGWGMKQTRILHFDQVLSVYEPARAESKAALPGAPEHSVPFVVGWGLSSFICCC